MQKTNTDTFTIGGKKWVSTNIIKKFPYLQEVDWVTEDTKVVGIWINSKDNLPNYIEWETFDGGFTLRCDQKLYTPIRMRIAFEDNATAAAKRCRILTVV